MSCLFESLGRFINVHPSQLRSEICNYLMSDPVLIGELTASMIVEYQPDIITLDESVNDPVNNTSRLKKYVSEMSKSIVMGGAIEIMAFCKIYNKNVTVKPIITPNMKPIEFVNDNATQTFTITWNGGHYEPSFT
jgi:hypothetical protein